MSTRKAARLEPFLGSVSKKCFWCKRIFYTTSISAKWCEKRCRDKARAASPEGHLQRKLWTRKQRLIALERYGGKCACCGIIEHEFLAIHHLEGGGGKHHAELRKEGITMIDFLRKNNYPPGFGILCHNCNCAKGFYGYCPHEKETNG